MPSAGCGTIIRSSGNCGCPNNSGTWQARVERHVAGKLEQDDQTGMPNCNPWTMGKMADRSDEPERNEHRKNAWIGSQRAYMMGISWGHFQAR